MCQAELLVERQLSLRRIRDFQQKVLRIKLSIWHLLDHRTTHWKFALAGYSVSRCAPDRVPVTSPAALPASRGLACRGRTDNEPSYPMQACSCGQRQLLQLARATL